MFIMHDKAVRKVLEQARTIAIVGAKDVPGQPVDRVGRYLIAAGYDVIPVHPKRRNVWGLPTYERLADIPHPIDIVDVFRASQYCLAHAEECLNLAPLPSLFWMQLGISNPEASALLTGAGILTVQDACLSVDHARLFGKFEPLPA